jgi:hypothetical protein
MRKISLLIIIVLFSYGCSDNKKLRVVSDLERGIVSIDSEVKGEIRIGYATFMVSSGDHSVEVKKLSKDGEWIYLANKNVSMAKENTTIVTLETKKIATQQREERLAQIAKKKEEKRLQLWNSTAFIVDKRNKLVWEQPFPSKKLKWEPAKQYCAKLEFGGSDNWRLPSKNELDTLVELSKEDKIVHPSIDPRYWSSTDPRPSWPRPYYVNIKTGSSQSWYSNRELYVSCVRDDIVFTDSKK